MAIDKFSPSQTGEKTTDVDKAHNNIDREHLIKQVYDQIYTVDIGLQNILIGKYSLKSDAVKQEALQYVRDCIIDKVVVNDSEMNWEYFLNSSNIRTVVYKRLLIDYFRKNSRNIFNITHFDDPESRVHNMPGVPVEMGAKIDLARILAVLKKKEKRFNSENAKKFIVIFNALLEGKEIIDIIEDNHWQITEARVSQIFTRGSRFVIEEYPNFPASIRDFKNILEDSTGEEYQNQIIEFIIETLRQEESRIQEKITNCREREEECTDLNNRLVCVKSILVPGFVLEGRLNLLRRRIWQELFPDKVYTEWTHKIRNVINNTNR